MVFSKGMLAAIVVALILLGVFIYVVARPSKAMNIRPVPEDLQTPQIFPPEEY